MFTPYITLTEGEAQALLEAGAENLRDQAFLLVMLGGGLRVSPFSAARSVVLLPRRYASACGPTGARVLARSNRPDRHSGYLGRRSARQGSWLSRLLPLVEGQNPFSMTVVRACIRMTLWPSGRIPLTWNTLSFLRSCMS